MSPLVRELLVNGLLAGAAVRTAKKSSSTVVFYGVAGGLAALAIVFLAIGWHNYLMDIYTIPVAGALTGLSILAVATFTGFSGYLVANQKRIARRMPHGERSFIDNIEHTLKGVLENFEEPVKDNPKMALLIAALAGLAAGDQLSDRLH